MATNRGKRISELTALTSASLDTTIVGIDNGTTYKIELDTLADAVTARVNIIDRDRLNSLEQFSSSLSIPNDSSLNSFTASQNTLNSVFTNGINARLQTSSFNDFSASVHSEILAATNEQSFNGLISGSSQLTSSYDERYVLSGSITQTTWDNIANKPDGIVSQSVDIADFTFTEQTITNGAITLQATNSDIVLNADGAVYIGSSNSGNQIVTDSYLGSVIGDTEMVNNGTGNTITDNLINIINSIPTIPDGIISGSEQITAFGFISSSQTIDTGSLATTGSNTFNGSQTINGPLTINISSGIPNGVSDWNGQGGWNQGFYSNLSTTGGTGTGLTVDVAAGGGGYIAIEQITINTAGSGYTNGDVITIDNENNLPGEFTIEVGASSLQFDASGSLVFPDTTIQTTAFIPTTYATTGSNTFTGDETITGSLFISGATELGGNIVPKTARGATLGTFERPFSEIFVSSGSINIASDTLGAPNTTLTNIGGNILVSAGGMRLVGDASFIATTGSFQYLSGSFTHIGSAFRTGDTVMIGNTITTGSLNVSGSTIMIGNNTMTGNTQLTGSVMVSGSLNVVGNAQIIGELTASTLKVDGLHYPTSDNGVYSFMQSDGVGNLTLQYVKTLYQNIRNKETSSILLGTPLFVSGSTGDNADVYIADAGNPLRMPATLIAGDSTLAANAVGKAIILGHIQGVDTTSYPPGTEVYVGVGGGWTATRPTGSTTPIQSLGVVTRQGNNGMGIVRTEGVHDLPNLRSGYVWVGGSNNQPITMTTGSFLTSSFDGRYVQTGSFNTLSSSVDSRLDTLEVSIITGSVNYVQVLGNRRTNITSTGVSIISGSITTTGNPVQIMVTGDANPVNVTSWTRLQIYRNENAIGGIVQVENSSNLNVPYCVNVIDTPPAGTYSYSMRTVSGISGVFDFGEASGPVLTAVELKTNTNLPSTNNTFTGTNTFNNVVTIGTNGGDEGGELRLGLAETNQSLTGSVIVDVYRNLFRILESGGTARGVNIDLSKAPSNANGELIWKTSGFVDAGTFVSLDNIKCTVTTSGNRGLSLGAVSTSYTANISGQYTVNGGTGGGTANNGTYTTTASNSLYNWHFPTEGDGSQYQIVDKTNNRVYRVSLMIGASYLNNFISIERLF
jgi:hypothetical protein